MSTPVTGSAPSSSLDYLTPEPRGYDPREGLPLWRYRLQTPTSSLGRGAASAKPSPAVLPPRPQNNSIDAPFNPATDIYEVNTVKAGDVTFATRYNNNGLLTQPNDDVSREIRSAALSPKPVRVDIGAPVIRDGIFTVNLRLRAETNQNIRVGAEAAVATGNVKATLGVFEKQPISSVLQADGRARTEVNGEVNWQVSKEVGLGLNVIHNSGGRAAQSETTRFDPSITVNVDGTQIKGGPTVTLDSRKGNTQLGGVLTVQPATPDNTRPYAVGVVKYGENPLVEGSQAFSVNVGLRF